VWSPEVNAVHKTLLDMMCRVTRNEKQNVPLTSEIKYIFLRQQTNNGELRALNEKTKHSIKLLLNI
jgi:hypothetical protein